MSDNSNSFHPVNAPASETQTSTKISDKGVGGKTVRWVAIGVAALVGVALLAMFGGGTQELGLASPTDQTVSAAAVDGSQVPTAVSVTSQADPYVTAVLSGVLEPPYNTTTIGKAFEGTFTNCNWQSSESDKGARFVEFTGRLKPEMYAKEFASAVERHSACLRNPPPNPDIDCASYAGTRFWTPERHNVCTNRRTNETWYPETIPGPDATLCGDPYDEEKFATVRFQFLFTADKTSFQLGYIDPSPWDNTPVKSYKVTGTTEHCTTFSDGSCNARWTTTRRDYSVTQKDIMDYIYK